MNFCCMMSIFFSLAFLNEHTSLFWRKKDFISDFQIVSRVGVSVLLLTCPSFATAAQVYRYQFVISASVLMLEIKYFKLRGLNCSELKIFASFLL